MKCEQLREQIWLYLYDELEGASRAAVEAHLKDCAACAQTVAEEKRLDSVLRERPLREPSPELLVACRAALEERLAEEALGWRAALRAWFGGTPVPAASRLVAVLTVLVLGFGAGWSLRPRLEGMPGSPARVATAAGMATDLSGVRISGIRDVSTDPQTGTVRLTLDAEQRLALQGTLDDPRIQQLLIYTVKNYENPGIRRQSLEVLRTRPKDPDVRDALIYALLNDQNAGVRREALSALSALAWETPIREGLIQVLQRDTNPGVRVAAINLLAEHTDESVLPVLRELSVKDRNPYVRWKCANAVRTLPVEQER